MDLPSALYSERLGIELKATLPYGELSVTLRNALWNVILARLFGKISSNSLGEIRAEYHVFLNLQKNFFKLPSDELEKHLPSRRDWYKDVFFTMEWNLVYDFFEFVAQRMIPIDAMEWERETNLAMELAGGPCRLASGFWIPWAQNPLSPRLEFPFGTQAKEFFETQNQLEAWQGLKSALSQLSALRKNESYWRRLTHSNSGDPISNSEETAPLPFGDISLELYEKSKSCVLQLMSCWGDKVKLKKGLPSVDVRNLGLPAWLGVLAEELLDGFWDLTEELSKQGWKLPKRSLLKEQTKEPMSPKPEPHEALLALELTLLFLRGMADALLAGGVLEFVRMDSKKAASMASNIWGEST